MDQHIVAAIDDLIEKLSGPLTGNEVANGWSERSQKAMLEFFQDLRLKLMSDDESLLYFSIVRGLDHWGVSGGELFQKAAEVDRELRETLG
jgi:hypothetical protein